MTKAAVLIIDDDLEVRSQLERALVDHYPVYAAGTAREALALMKRQRPPLITLELGLPPRPNNALEGLALLDGLLTVDRFAKVVVLTGNSERTSALAAIQQGAYDYIQKPVQTETLKLILERAFYLYQLEMENLRLQQQGVQEEFQGIIGTSPPMLQMFETIRRVAASDLSVLIVGESGTGKELVARAIHRESIRKSGPFIAINCGAIPENLLESELFGHEKGAFTGAHVQRKGRIESALGGTLLLDEIGELPLALQVKLLRFLQEQRIERIGGRELIPVDTRIIAATNMNLDEALERGQFRKDLFYRLNVVQVRVPPLRERTGDPASLARAFVLRCRDELNPSVTGLSEEAREVIQSYSWPGNVRELENRIKRGIVMARGKSLTSADLELTQERPAYDSSITLREARSRLERNLICQALARTNGNVTRAAEELGISRQALHESMHKYGLGKHKIMHGSNHA
jgi:two-component system, NtrC family, response regulator